MTLAQIRGGFGQPESPNLQRSAAGYGSGNDAVELCYTSLHRSPPTCSITSNALILSQPLAKRPHKSCGKQLPPVFFQLDQRHSRNDDEGEVNHPAHTRQTTLERLGKSAPGTASSAVSCGRGAGLRGIGGLEIMVKPLVNVPVFARHYLTSSEARHHGRSDRSDDEPSC
ncbi:hypothetical protein PG995_001859 [Apiospora arundinis]